MLSQGTYWFSVTAKQIVKERQGWILSIPSPRVLIWNWAFWGLPVRIFQIRSLSSHQGCSFLTDRRAFWVHRTLRKLTAFCTVIYDLGKFSHFHVSHCNLLLTKEKKPKIVKSIPGRSSVHAQWRTFIPWVAMLRCFFWGFTNLWRFWSGCCRTWWSWGLWPYKVIPLVNSNVSFWRHCFLCVCVCSSHLFLNDAHGVIFQPSWQLRTSCPLVRPYTLCICHSRSGLMGCKFTSQSSR